MGIYGLRAQIYYHRKRFPARHSLTKREYGHFTEFVKCLRSGEEYVYSSHCEGYFVEPALSVAR